MRFTVPLYVESWKPSGQKTTQHTVRPLFFELPQFSNERLGKAMERCVSELNKTLARLGHEGKHDEVSRYAFCPEIEQHRFKLEFEIDGDPVRIPVAVFAFRANGRKTGFLPARRDVWFELHRGDDIEARAQSVIERLLKSADRRGEDARAIAEELTLRGKASVTTVEFSCDVIQRIEPPKKNLFALLGATEKMDGARELERTGRCLDRMYPDRLATALLREREVEELFRLLNGRDRRPVLLVGPRRSGKTAVLHEAVRRIVDERGSAFEQKRNTWLLSPQRLISGMKYVGQWESRLRAILEFAAKHNHTLYFDDLLGTFRAGISRDSNLSVSQLLKPCLEERNVRILGEITPEALRVLRERDRSFADQFHTIRIDETDPPATLRILLALVRRLERSHSCEFGLDVLPETLDLCRRFRAESAFPGKAADVLLRLAARRRGETVQREHVLEDFQADSGLERNFVDRRTTLPREQVVTGLRRMLIGQEPAVSVLADVLTVAKAGLQDPRRPLGSLLFLGPTGVGKTQCAKAVARHLFQSADRLVRFDMNEYNTPSAVPRLVGTFDQPEGVLTRAVARQPFSVLLLDEIEKAHPDVFDLLLQVLGEGRLTDSLGRTVDFTQSIIILTSNLGSREAAANVGFARSAEDRTAIYRKAVREFFRPEFVNRIDHVVPFERLTREEVLEVSRMILADLSRRDGLLRRRSLFDVTDAMLERVVQAGFDPAWGARGVRRAIEQQLARPAALALAAFVPTMPSVVSFAAGANEVDGEGWTAHVSVLQNAPRLSDVIAGWTPPSEETLCGGIDRAAARIERLWAPYRSSGTLDVSKLTAEQETCLAHLDALRRVRTAARHVQNRRSEELEERLSAHRGRSVAATRISRPRFGRLHIVGWWSKDPSRSLLAEMASADDVHDYLETLFREGEELAESQFDGPGDSSPHTLVRRVALLEAMAPREGERRVLMLLRGIGKSGWRHRLAETYGRSFSFPFHAELAAGRGLREDVDGSSLSIERRIAMYESAAEMGGQSFAAHERWSPDAETLESLRRTDASAIVFEGEGSGALVGPEAGTHLCFHASGATSLVVVDVMELADGDDAEAVLRRAVSAIIAPVAGTPAIPPVVRIYDEKGTLVDLQTGVVAEATGGLPSNLNELALARLPIPEELRG